MKLTGIIQHLDKKGRIGIPTGLKYVIGIQEDTVPIEFYCSRRNAYSTKI